MNYHLLTYLLYLTITVAVTIWVARTLGTNGQVFLYDIFKGNDALAGSVNKLLQVGFYLVNLGYAVYTMKIMRGILNATDMAEELSQKIGFIILILGAWHLVNIWVLFKLRRRALEEQSFNAVGA
jgi:hypothetical protein